MRDRYRGVTARAKQRKALDSSAQDQSEEVDKTYKKIPTIIITMMTSPYTLGEAMVAAAAADGGNSAVDELFRKTPPNESALLDPLKGLTERGDTVDVDTPKVADGEKKIDSGGLGALTWYLMLAERLPLLDALGRRGRPGRGRVPLLQARRQRVRACGVTPGRTRRPRTTCSAHLQTMGRRPAPGLTGHGEPVTAIS